MSNITGLIIVGLIICIWGITGALSGNMKVGSKHPSRQPDSVIYQGSALGIVFAVTGAILAVLGVAARLNKPLLTPDQAIKYAVSVGIGGAVISVVLIVINLFTRGIPPQDADSAKAINHPMSLSAAAKYLHMPEDELLQMAENGAVKAHHINGKYLFDGEILQDLRDVVGHQ